MSAPRAQRLPQRWQAVVHALLVVGGWLVFVLWWLEVLRQPQDRRNLWLLVAAAAVIAPTVTWWWVWHNLALFRRLGPRRTARAVESRYERDFNGRTIDADWPALREAALVVIDNDATHKRFRTGGALR